MSERWDSLLDGELDELTPHVEDSLRNGDFELKLSDLAVMQQICESSYRECEDEQQDAAWMGNRLLAEIAGQLARQAQASERIVSLLDGFRRSGFPVENVS